ncbi:MAG: pyridoxal phosphate-dependent aminotransferase [Oscillospiraceae bacterium]|nr:pyridoxal phosphate-dependent aminotransferase [Oscillospiraceae bacterium]
MKYNFDIIHDRKNTGSLKWDCAEKRGKPADVLPLWVADMDFKVPAEVEEALVKSARHGIFGYSEPEDSYFEAVQSWFSERFGYKSETEWIVLTPGIVFALAVAVRSFTEAGDSVMLQQPVYHPFANVILDNSRKLVNNSLVYRDGRYSIDFEDFERKIIKNKVKLFILCSPHNPVGRVWTAEELTKMGEICLRHKVLVASDEIHCDFVYEPHRHTVFAALNPKFADNSIILTSPGKTFNLAGLQASNIFITNPDLRKRFVDGLEASGYSQLNTMGLVSCEAAYRYGGSWLDELKEYLAGNIRAVSEFAEAAGIKLIPTEGTYLVWLDFSSLGIKNRRLEDLFLNQAKLWLCNGLIFGKEGEEFWRINIACPRKILEEALERIKLVINR